MKNMLTIVCFFCSFLLFSQGEGRIVISMNGEWEFDQTKTAFPPAKFTREIRIDKNLSNRQMFLTIKKSQYVTMVYVNGMLMERSIECYTPIDVNITGAIRFGEENEILIQVGDRAWLPSEAAGSTDKEKIKYLPGIWDDVFISATYLRQQC